MRYGLEQSKNLMTVHIAMDAGMENVIRTFERVGVAEPDAYQPYPAFALGAGDTTVERLTAAYAMLVNHGRLIQPSVIDFVQDRHGKVIWRADERECEGCNMDEWDGEPMPRFGRRGTQVMDGRTAFQTLHMLTGVVQRGTATRLRSLDLPLFGKTGTSSGPTNAWFVGGSTNIVAGTYLGFDNPRNMDGWVQGGNTAAPIFKQFVQESRNKWSDRPFLAPDGVRMVRIDRMSGRRVFSEWPSDDPGSSVIWEAFQPDTQLRRSLRKDEIDAMRELILTQLRAQDEAARVARGEGQLEPENFAEEQGGLY